MFLRAAIRFFRDIFYSISIISLIILAVLNTTSVYKYAIQKYELNKYTGLPTELLMDNYKRVINYVQNPLVKELELNKLPMSDFGRIHFFEVKRIFIALYIIGIIFIAIMIFKVLTNKENNLGKEIIKSFNRSVNIIAIIFIVVSIMSARNFSETFIYFHKIFFRNNYWIFDPTTDPIINALPEEFFMIELIFIIVLLVIFTLVVKAIYLRNKLITKKSY